MKCRLVFLLDRSRVKRNTAVVYALVPMLNSSFVKYDDGVTVPNITLVNQGSLKMAFGVVQNLPGLASSGIIEIFLKFKVSNNPLVLSGRSLALAAILNFDAGSDVTTRQFAIVGPSVKPFLTIVKSVKVTVA